MKSAPMKYKMYITDLMCARLINKLKEKIRRGREGKKGGFLIHKKVGHGKNALVVGQMCFQLVRKNSKIT